MLSEFKRLMDQDMESKMKEGLAKYARPIVTRSKEGPMKETVLKEAASEDKNECK